MIGTTLGERYRLEEELGRGGMGTVYRARDTALQRDVAVKLLSNTRLGTEGQARLTREAQIVAGLDHPNIVTVHDVGEYEGQPFIVMQLLEGGTLHDRRPTSLDQILPIVRQVCQALDYAHQQGIIHRDLKPENVALAPDGTARLMDFGLARSVATRMTTEGTVMGTVDYMAPEQVLGKELDQRADLYALGVLLYELTTGRLPFSGDSPVAVISQHLHAPVVPPRAKDPAIPAWLDRLIARLLAKDRDDRPASAAEVLQVLEQPELLEAGGHAAEEPTTLERIARGRMIGREAEFDQARQLWAAAVNGRSQILLVSGEPGVGKTRLLREIETQAEVMGARVLGAASYAEGGPPYAPFKKMLRQVLPAAAQNGLVLPDAVLADLLALAPEFRVQFPDVPPNPPGDAQTDRHRLFESFYVLVAALSQQVPLLLYLDDAHWADSGSLGLFRHLCRQVGQQPVMLMGTYREMELDENQPLNEVLLQLSREARATRIKLGRLSLTQTERLLSYFFQEEITADFLTGIYRETEGNPFFIEEVCKALVESGKLVYQDGRWHRPPMRELGIPQNVKVAIQSRIGKLPEQIRAILRQAAVLGREFDFDTLVTAVEGDEEAVIVALEEAERAQLVEEQSEDGQLRFAFSHALMAAVLVEGLRILQRRRLHRRAAAALAQHDPENFTALGMHLLEAGQTEQGVDYLLRAGDRARLLYAHQEAIHHYLQALDFAKEGDDHAMAARTLMKLGVVYHNAFEFEQSRQAYEQGFVYWQRAGQVGRPGDRRPAPHPLRLPSIPPPTLDPGFTNDVTSGTFINQLFSGLVELTPDMSIVPGVARSWDVLEGGRVYRFQLRDDVTWSDGQPLTAADFEFAWKRALDPVADSPGAGILLDIRGAEAWRRGEGSADALGVRAHGPHTLVVELERPTGYFLQLLEVSTTHPVPRHVVEAHGEGWASPDKLVGNGPFRIQSWTDEAAVLERNPRYHGQATGNVAELTVTFIGADTDLVARYDADELDVLFLGDLAAEAVDRVRQRHADDYLTLPWLATLYLSFDCSQPPFDDVRVRRAFAQALDLETLAAVGARGLYVPAKGGLVPPGLPGHAPDAGLAYAPESARDLLRQAGYGDVGRLSSVSCWRPNFPAIDLAADVILSQWQQNLGLDISWRALDWGDFLSSLGRELPNMWLLGWAADYPDPDSFLRLAAQQNWGRGWRNKRYTELVEKARRSLNQAERLQLYHEAQLLLAQEVPVVPILYARFHGLLKPWLAELPLSPMRGDYFKDAVLLPHE